MIILKISKIISCGYYENQHEAIIAFVNKMEIDPDNNKILIDFFELPLGLLVITNNGAPNL